MLSLKNITKTYQTGSVKFGALNDVSVSFRKSEFVSILGPSGCGKTTLLNIIGGLDRYSSGDLVIEGKSTKDFTDKDWDTYRNHRVGFVFQSYNLIPHQTVLQNVELALTLSGVDKKERKRRATEALQRVGLGDKLKNRPNQLSGGQMQRVAIARALVNDPEIVLADEPTGALDTESSVQIMEVLKEISKTRLVVMVTHNPELAEQYSTRIVRLLDGKIQSDTQPYNPRKTKYEEEPKKSTKKRMSFFTAMSLSFKNLMTKKARTALVAVAGSIGIIGIALILAISSGFSNYVNKMQQETLSSYPITLSNQDYDISNLMQMFFSSTTGQSATNMDKVYTKNELTTMLQEFNTSSQKNDLASFKAYLDSEGAEKLEEYTTAIQYEYPVDINAFFDSAENGLTCVNPSTVFADKITEYAITHPNMTEDQQMRFGLLNYMFGNTSSFYSNEFWGEMLDNQAFLQSQYELVGSGSQWANEANEVMIVLDKNNQLTDYTLMGLGLIDQDLLTNYMDNYINNDQEIAPINASFTYEQILGLEYKLILESSFFQDINNDGKYVDIRTLKTTNPSEYASRVAALYADDANTISIRVAGLIRPKADVTTASISTAVAYTSALTDLVIERNNANNLIAAQKATTTTNVLTGEAFDTTTISALAQQADVLASLGYVDTNNPSAIYLYPTKFEDKEVIANVITEYNNACLALGDDSKVITYSDTVGTMMSSISTIISAITYVLIAFVAVSLVVSSIMIGIITYISVIERTKEIGVLRSVGASKKDVKRVFTAESFLIGLSSGLLGVIVAGLLTIPINIVLSSVAGISGVAMLPIVGAVILVAISVILTFIAGLIPARIAAKKDPVVALRAE